MTADDEIERLRTKVRQLAFSALRKGVPYLLSALGKDLGNDLQAIKDVTKLGLGEFIEKYVSDDLLIVLGGTYGNIKSVVLKNEIDLPTEVVELETQAEETRRPRLHYRFWAAFSVPLEAEHRRFIKLGDFYFRDVTNGHPEDNELEIARECIPAEGIQDRDAAIHASIEQWITQAGRSPDEFLQPKKLAQNSRIPMGDKSTLHRLIEALDKRQLASVSLPLDVVATLLNARS